MKLDLHGYTIHEAWQKYQSFIFNCDVKSVVIITGQGQIEREFLKWDHPRNIREITPLPHKGGFRINFLKKKKA
jgi:DNA-nicking Smr family endonuclease